MSMNPTPPLATVTIPNPAPPARRFWGGLTATGKAILVGGAALLVLLTVIIAANQRDERSYHQGYSFGYDTGACSSIRGMWQLSSDRDQWDVDDMYDGCVAGAKDGGWR